MFVPTFDVIVVGRSFTSRVYVKIGEFDPGIPLKVTEESAPAGV